MAAGSLIAAAAAAAQKRAADAADGAWGPFARAHGFEHRPSSIGQGGGVERVPRVSGASDGVSIAFELSNMEGDWGMTAVAVPPSPVAVRVELAPEGLMQKLAKIFGAQDIVLGDAAFDKTYIVRGTTVEGARAVLTTPIRAEILAMNVATLVYDDGSTKERGPVVVLGVRALLTEHAALERLVRLLVALGKITPQAA